MIPKIIYLSSAIIFIAISIVLSNSYRKEIYSNQANEPLEEIIANIGGNFFVVPILCFSIWLLNRGITSNKYLDILIVFIFYSISELLSMVIPSLGIFDFYDVYGFVFGTLITLLITFLVESLSTHLK